MSGQAAFLAGHGDGVRRLPAGVQVQDRVEHQRVRRLVEIPRPQRLDHIGDGVLGPGWVVPDAGGVGWVLGTRPGFTGDAARGVPATVTP